MNRFSDAQRICASPASPLPFSYRREWDGFRKGVDLAEKKDFLHYKTRKKNLGSDQPWPLAPYKT